MPLPPGFLSMLFPYLMLLIFSSLIRVLLCIHLISVSVSDFSEKDESLTFSQVYPFRYVNCHVFFERLDANTKGKLH